MRLLSTPNSLQVASDSDLQLPSPASSLGEIESAILAIAGEILGIQLAAAQPFMEVQSLERHLKHNTCPYWPNMMLALVKQMINFEFLNYGTKSTEAL